MTAKKDKLPMRTTHAQNDTSIAWPFLIVGLLGAST
jgi:hypothetical protein